MAERESDEIVARILGAMSEEERARVLAALASYLPARWQELVLREAEYLMDPSRLRIRIIEDPLTAHNLNMIIAAVTDLHTRCWLIEQYRLADLMNYAQTHDIRFMQEANLRIVGLSYASPALIDFLVGSASIAGTATLALALKTAIDAVVQAPLRFRATQLQNQKEALEQKVREQEAQQAQQIAAQKAETENKAALQEQQLAQQKAQADLERQTILLDLTKQQIEIERQQLQVDKQRLELEKDRVKIVLEIAKTMVGQLQPNTDVGIGEMLMVSLVPSLLQLATSDGLELAWLAPQKDNEKEKPSENA